MKDQYVIDVKRVPGVTRREMAQYIRDAIISHSGGGDPEDPLMDATKEPGFITVRTVPRGIGLAG